MSLGHAKNLYRILVNGMIALLYVFVCFFVWSLGWLDVRPPITSCVIFIKYLHSCGM